MISAACSLPAVARAAAFKPTVLLSLQRGEGAQWGPPGGGVPPLWSLWGPGMGWGGETVGVGQCVGWGKPTVQPSSGVLALHGMGMVQAVLCGMVASCSSTNTRLIPQNDTFIDPNS